MSSVINCVAYTGEERAVSPLLEVCNRLWRFKRADWL